MNTGRNIGTNLSSGQPGSGVAIPYFLVTDGLQILLTAGFFALADIFGWNDCTY